MGLAFWRNYHEQQAALAETERPQSPVEALANVIGKPEEEVSEPEPKAPEAPQPEAPALPAEPKVTRSSIAQRRQAASESE